MKIIKNILIVIASVFIGGFVNMGIIMISSSIIPPPEGADVTTMEGLKASMHLFGPKNFIMPFLAHALGTFVGAFLVAWMIPKHKMKFALGVGAWNLIGGITNVILLPSPLAFTLIDLGLAYLPMAFLGGKLGMRMKKEN